MDEYTLGDLVSVFDSKQNVKYQHQIYLNVFQTLAYTNKYSLPDDSRTKEILIRRHASIRRSVRAASFRELVGLCPIVILVNLFVPSHLADPHCSSSAQPGQNTPRSHKYYSLQPGGDLETAFALRRRSHGEFVRTISHVESFLRVLSDSKCFYLTATIQDSFTLIYHFCVSSRVDGSRPLNEAALC